MRQPTISTTKLYNKIILRPHLVLLCKAMIVSQSFQMCVVFSWNDMRWVDGLPALRQMSKYNFSRLTSLHEATVRVASYQIIVVCNVHGDKGRQRVTDSQDRLRYWFQENAVHIHNYARYCSAFIELLNLQSAAQLLIYQEGNNRGRLTRPFTTASVLKLCQQSVVSHHVLQTDCVFVTHATLKWLDIFGTKWTVECWNEIFNNWRFIQISNKILVFITTEWTNRLRV